MNHGAYGRLVDPQAEGDGAHEHARLVVHPAFLVAAAQGILHLAVIGDRGDAALGEGVDGAFHLLYGGRVDDGALSGIGAQPRQEQRQMRVAVALAHYIAQISAVEAGDVLMGVAQLQLFEDIVPHAAGGAGGEGGDGLVREVLAERTELAVFGAELVAPFGDAVGFVDGEEGQRNPPQPTDGIGAGQAFRRKVEQAESALLGRAHDGALILGGLGAIEERRRDTHIAKLRHLILHERDEGRDDHHGPAERQRGQLVTQGLAAAGGHDDGDVPAGQQAFDDALLQGAEGIVAPVALQGGVKIGDRRGGFQVGIIAVPA